MLPQAGGTPLAAFIPAAECRPSGTTWPAPGASRPRHCRIEVELALRLAADLPGGATPATVLAAVADALIVFEVLGSRFDDPDPADTLAYLADGQGNAGIVAGSPIAGWQDLDLASLDITLRIDAGLHAARNASRAQVFDALAWLADHAARQGMGLKAGQIIITGARIGPVELPCGSTAHATGPGGATVEMTLGR